MARMRNYCKAYPIARLRAYNHWSENDMNSRMEPQVVDRKEAQAPRVLGDEEYLYLQEYFVVTDGIFIDQNIIFDRVTDEWKEFCRNTLMFDVNGSKTVKERAS